jgi:hypothetical protein
MPTPPITDQMRRNARANPDSWLYVIDEEFDARGDVPPWAVAGRYPVDADGEVVEEFHPNPEYRPSPTALRLPAPQTELEGLLQRVLAGHRPSSELPAAALRSPLWVYAVSPQQSNLTGFHDKNGRVVVPAYTSKAMVPDAWPGSRVRAGRELLPLLAGHPLAINPHGLVTAVIPAEQLTAAAHENRRSPT